MKKLMVMLRNMDKSCAYLHRKKEEFDKPTRDGLTLRLNFSYWLDYNYGYYAKRFEETVKRLQDEGLKAELVKYEGYMTLHIAKNNAWYRITIEQV